ncbi:Alpha/beta hydrolase fold-1 [Cinnamomum micranthum f. kanehirae]|uniref:Alpha/beta hydrolase fold-1 n=1 Tax=Cinnamomum micranthum f. kanehirae TaxID=337451 RepID=A0A3S3NCI7_9MAGN|nr:Alpha/beta hydrolase fold-1 [Cinnamomum micranthum f. kanehirae]
MEKCLSFNFSITSARDWIYRQTFFSAGLRPSLTHLPDGTTMHCWVPHHPAPHKPSLLLLHGFGANAMWQWSDQLRPFFLSRFNIYVPDLLFFGDSFTTRPDRSESFQARSVMALMETMGVRRMSVVGISYGGFVGYSMAAQFNEAVERLVLCSTGVCFEERDLKEGLFPVSDVEEAASVLVPQTPEKMRELVKGAFHRPWWPMPTWFPNDLIDVDSPLLTFFLEDYIHVMSKEHAEEQRDLIRAILKDRKHLNLPKIAQPTLIVWGEHDQLFPLELAHRLQRHLEGNSRLVIIKNAGHGVHLEKPKVFYKLLKGFLTDNPSQVFY